jgi:NADH-quinone oxidoreductase subunit N
MFQIPNLAVIQPELIMLGMTCLVLLAGLRKKSIEVSGKDNLVYGLSQLTLILTAFSSYSLFGTPTEVTFSNSFIADNLGVVLKVSICISLFFVFAFTRDYLHAHKLKSGEYYPLALFSALGMMVLVSAYNFITLFMGLELLSLPIYALVAIRRDEGICTEAAVKYFIMGALATGVMLYGFSMIYGVTHSMEFTQIAASAITQIAGYQTLVGLFGLVFVMVGFAFKLGLVPFHMWVPDVYEGAPTPVTLFIAAAPKIAAFAMIFRLLTVALPNLHVHWEQMLIILAVLSIGIGNIVAVVQSNLKRLLAYSSIAHMGYMILGIITFSHNGYAASMFYAITYALTTIAAFGLILLMSRRDFDAQHLDDFKGLNSRDPWMALVMMLVMFSMAGVPPFIGFMAKLSLLEALVHVHLVWLAVVAILFSIIGAYYYIRVIKVMYFEKPEVEGRIACTTQGRTFLYINGLAILLLGIFPGVLFHLCQSVL